MADPVSVLKDYDAAWNAHDVEGVMAFFTDDAVVRLEPAPPDEFGEFIEAESRYALAMSSRLWQASTSTPGTIK
jgi:ketosteroid isomerase-like protein